MSSNEERRAEARKRLRDEMAAQKKRERNTTIAVVAVAALVVLGLVIWGVSYKVADNNRKEQLAADQEALRQYNTQWAACTYPPDTEQPQPVTDEEMAGFDEATKKQAEEYNDSLSTLEDKKREGTPPTGDQYKSGIAQITLATSEGDIPLTLDRAQAPCNVASFIGLVQQEYFNDTPCHRLTVADEATADTGGGLSVLQCGDPTGTGLGGPGYTVVDEPPTDLAPGPDGQSVIYPRGTIAMAKSQSPNSAGSQFFLVYQDSTLPPSYSVLGTIGDDGLKVIDKIAAAGTKSDDPQSPDAEKPKTDVTINTATVEDMDTVPPNPGKPDVELPEDEAGQGQVPLPPGGLPGGDTGGTDGAAPPAGG